MISPFWFFAVVKSTIILCEYHTVFIILLLGTPSEVLIVVSITYLSGHRLSTTRISMSRKNGIRIIKVSNMIRLFFSWLVIIYASKKLWTHDFSIFSVIVVRSDRACKLEVWDFHFFCLNLKLHDVLSLIHISEPTRPY